MSFPFDPEKLIELLGKQLSPDKLIETLLPLKQTLEIKVYKSKDKEGKEWLVIMVRKLEDTKERVNSKVQKDESTNR